MLVDVAVVLSNGCFTRKFEECLELLKWNDDDTALKLFTGMCQQDCLCPTLSRGNYNCLRMSWRNDDFELIIWLYQGKDRLKYAMGKIPEQAEIRELMIPDAFTLLEYWANYLKQAETKSGTTT